MKLNKALHENKDDDGFGPTIKKAAKNPDGTEKDKWRTTGGAAFEDNIQVQQFSFISDGIHELITRTPMDRYYETLSVYA